MPTRLKNYVLLLPFSLLLAGCGGSYTWGWYVISPNLEKGRENLLFLLSGLGQTIAVALCAITLSVMIGLLVSLAVLSPNRFLRGFGRAYVEVLRSVPMLVMVLWVYYGLPIVFDLSPSAFTAGVLALALCDSAFQAEIFRAGIQSIDRGQHEAADGLGLSYLDKFRYVIMPQAIVRVLPPLGNQFVYMLKTSSLLSVIGLTELTRRANELITIEYRPLEIYSFLVLEYLALILLASWLVRRLEKRMSTADRARSQMVAEIGAIKPA